MEWKRLLYLTANDWKSALVSEATKDMLTEDLKKAMSEKKWISFAGLGDAWGM